MSIQLAHIYTNKEVSCYHAILILLTVSFLHDWYNTSCDITFLSFQMLAKNSPSFTTHFLMTDGWQPST